MKIVSLLIGRIFSWLLRTGKRWQYRGFKPGHVFDIRVDDMAFKMSFGDYRLGGAIIERIEGRREPSTVAIIKSLVHEGNRVVELGGCYGYFTMIMSRCAGASGQVVSIEGTPNNLQILENNLRLNGVSNVKTYNVFVTSRASEARFTPDERHPYGAISRLDGETPQNGNTISVPAVRLSTFLEDIRFQPDHLFMDIEGFEAEVFEDFATGYLTSHRPVIVFERHEQFYHPGRGLDYITGVLDTNGYTYRRIAGNLVCFPGSIPVR